MSISSIGGSTAQQAILSQLGNESANEGVLPDGDNDRDDVSNISPRADTQQAGRITESIGKNLNVFA